jgi:preprotein translocase subunit YajC
MIISAAYAQAAAGQAAQGSTTFGLILNFIVIFGIFYLLLIRPQIKKSKEYSNMLNNLSKGDTIVTGGGIIAKIHKIKDNKAEVDINETTRVTILLSTIKEVFKDSAESKKEPEDKKVEDKTSKETKKSKNTKSNKLKKMLEK